jgi:D-alanyl-D-alanine carboxypeptidase
MDMPVEPASLTKLMSAYLVFDALKSSLGATLAMVSCPQVVYSSCLPVALR